MMINKKENKPILFSQGKNKPINLYETNIILEPLDSINNTKNATLIFRNQENTVELFLPEKESIILKRTNEKDNIWKKNDLEFIISKKYLLRKNGIIIYQSQ